MADSRPLLLEVEHLCNGSAERTAGDVLQRKEKRYLKAVNDVSFQLVKGKPGSGGRVGLRQVHPGPHHSPAV